MNKTRVEDTAHMTGVKFDSSVRNDPEINIEWPELWRLGVIYCQSSID
jgi:hypothetical protein